MTQITRAFFTAQIDWPIPTLLHCHNAILAVPFLVNRVYEALYFSVIAQFPNLMMIMEVKFNQSFAFSGVPLC